MKLLLLSSSPIQKKIQLQLLKLLDKKPEEAKVAIIPTAGYPKIDQKYVDFDKNILQELGVKDIIQVDLKENSKESLEEKLVDRDIIWVCGGNTFWLLHWVRKSEFDKLLPKLLVQGKVYVGISAGTLICGKDISISGWRSGWDRNVVGLKNLSGLGFVDYAISPHYVDSDKEIIKNCSNKTGVKIIPLKDGESVVVNK